MNIISQWGYNPLGIPSQIPVGFCNVPTGLVFNVTGNSVRLSWTSPHDYAAYYLEYRKVGTVPKLTLLVYGANTKLEGLDATAEYEWWISTVCDIAANRKSTATSGPNFTTGAAIVVHDKVLANEITVIQGHTDAAVSWIGSSGADGYELYYRPLGFGAVDWEIVSTKQLNLMLTNLFSAMDYEVRVDSVYGNIVETGEVKAFKTLALTLPNVRNLRVYPDSEAALATWTPVDNAISYNVLLNGVLYRSAFMGTHININQLSPETPYDLTVIANAEIGTSQPAVIDFSTISKAVDPITNLVAVISGHDIIITWVKNPLADAQVIFINGTSFDLAANIETYTITNAIPSNIYNIAVIAELAGKASESVATRTTMDFYVQTLEKPYLIRSYRTELSIAWKSCVGTGISYDLEVTDTVTSAVTIINTIVPAYIVDGLVSLRAYQFRVRAKTLLSTGSWSDSDTFTTTAGVSASTIYDLVYRDPKNGKITIDFKLVSGMTEGNFTIVFTAAGHPTITVSSIETIGNEITGLVAGVTYDVAITNHETDCVDFVLNSTYLVPASIGVITGLALSLSGDKRDYSLSGTGVGGATYRFRYRVIGDIDWMNLGTFDTLAKTFTLISGHYEFEVVMLKDGLETDPQTVAAPRFSPVGVDIQNIGGKIYVNFQRIISRTGFALDIEAGDTTIIAAPMGEMGGNIGGFPFGLYQFRIKNLYDNSYSDTTVIMIGNDINVLFTSDIYECIGCCDTLGNGSTVLKTYAQTIIGPQTFTIPDNVNAFSITNLGNGSKVYQPIGITGIPGISEIPANLRVYNVAAEGDNVVLDGIITIAPASGHSVFITYLM